MPAELPSQFARTHGLCFSRLCQFRYVGMSVRMVGQGKDDDDIGRSSRYRLLREVAVVSIVAFYSVVSIDFVFSRIS